MLAIVTTNLLRRKARTLLTASGIAVGVAMIVALLSFTQGLKETAAGFVHLGGSDLGVFQANVSDPTASLLPESIVARVAALPQVSRATPLLLIVEGVQGDPSAIVFGADPGGFFTRSLVLVAGAQPDPTPGESARRRPPRGAAASRAGLDASTCRGRPYAVAGVYHSGILFEDSGAVLPLAAAQQVAGPPRRGDRRRRPARARRCAPSAARRAIERELPGHAGDHRPRSRRSAPARTAR